MCEKHLILVFHIHNWYRSINGSPGQTAEAFQLLKLKVQSTEKRILCALIADEMAIRSQDLTLKWTMLFLNNILNITDKIIFILFFC